MKRVNIKRTDIKRIDIKIGFQCNNLCHFCVQGNKRDNAPDKTHEEVRSILQDNAQDHKGVIFTGGEPTIHKELVEWVGFAKGLGYQSIQIQSNGRLFAYLDYCKVLIAAGANFFSPALHGSSSEMHDRLTRASGSFKQTTQGIKNLISLGQNVGTNSVINKMNYRDLSKLAELLIGLGVKQFQLAFMHINHIIASDPKLVEEIVPRYPIVESYVKKALQVGIDAGISVITEAMPYCFMSGYEDYVGEYKIPDGVVYDAGMVIKNFTHHRQTSGKAKGLFCKQCQYDCVCEGPWKDYPELFGWKEFKPVKNTRKGIMNSSR